MLTLRVPEAMATWLQEKAARTGISQGQIIRQQLEQLRTTEKRRFMRLAGAVHGGTRNLSTRKGYSKK